MAKPQKIQGGGSNRKTAFAILKKEVMIRADLQIDDEIEIYVNSRKEVVIKKVFK